MKRQIGIELYGLRWRFLFRKETNTRAYIGVRFSNYLPGRLI